ncbi:MAG: flagellar assembly protein FliW [Candidatus Didemnitutus sp.]|nr:flagellar assembly protein FliW [Candidatus Didemnitutus sp.]
MKVLPSNHTHELESPVANRFTLPQGIIGFTDFNHADLLYFPDHLPFLWMKLSNDKNESVHFVVLEPGGLIANYSPELFDDDAESLKLADPSEAMVLNIVTLEQQCPLEAKVNLIGPIIVNRRTKLGRQLVISNYSHYSAHHPLVDTSSIEATAASA